MKINTEPVRGTKDFLPKEMILRDYVKETILDTYKKNGFLHIKTPILEDINLLKGTDSGDNAKIMFKVLKRGEKLKLDIPDIKENDLCDLGLRYDLTVPLARFYANHNNELPNPFKSIQLDDAFRAERPQRGRLRQFTQCDIDILGDSSPNAEVEILLVAGETLTNLGFKNFTFRINDRRILNSVIVNAGFGEDSCIDICTTLDKMDKVGIDGVRNELLSKEYDATAITKLLDAMQNIKDTGTENLSQFGVPEEYISRVNYIISMVNSVSPDFRADFDVSIVRGQGYYTSSVFEVYLDGFAGACGGGGRYDKMIEKMIGVSVCAVGFSIGYERVCLILEEKQIEDNSIVLVYNPKSDDFSEVLKRFSELKKDYRVTLVPRAKNLNFQLTKFKNNGFKNYIIFGTENINTIE